MEKSMKKTMCMVLLMAASIVAANAAEQTDNKPEQAKTDTVTVKEQVTVLADSIGQKSVRLGRRVADGAVVAADSIGAAGQRFGEKAAVWGDTLAEQSRRAWKNFKSTISR